MKTDKKDFIFITLKVHSEFKEKNSWNARMYNFPSHLMNKVEYQIYLRGISQKLGNS